MGFLFTEMAPRILENSLNTSNYNAIQYKESVWYFDEATQELGIRDVQLHNNESLILSATVLKGHVGIPFMTNEWPC